MSGSLDHTQRSPADQDLGHIGLHVFGLLGVNVAADTPDTARFLARVLPASRGRSYVRALVDAYRGRDGRVRAFSEAEEAEWLARNLDLRQLADPALDAHLSGLWHTACRRAGVAPGAAPVDTGALYGAIERLAFVPAYDDEEILRELSSVVSGGRGAEC